MTDTWFISDTHFQHKNIIKFCRPEFADVDEMNEFIIEQWNSHIAPTDRVIHGGDITFGSKDRFCENIFPRLNGEIELILGNHDDPSFLVKRGIVKKIHVWMPLPNISVVVSHIPLHVSQLVRGSKDRETPALNIHGHIHEKESPVGPYRNICVEKTNYCPIHIDNLNPYKE